jgi:hypothetical protein
MELIFNKIGKIFILLRSSLTRDIGILIQLSGGKKDCVKMFKHLGLGDGWLK